MKRLMLIGILCGLTIFTSPWSLAQTKIGHPPKPDIPTGHLLYDKYCLGCHGAALDGKGPDAASFKVAPTNFHIYLSRLKDDRDLKKTITEGKRFLGMHNWEDTFGEWEIDSLILYIRSAAPQVKVKP